MANIKKISTCTQSWLSNLLGIIVRIQRLYNQFNAKKTVGTS